MHIAHCDRSRDKSISKVESHVNSDGVIVRGLDRSNTEVCVQCAIGTKNPETTVAIEFRVEFSTIYGLAKHWLTCREVMSTCTLAAWCGQDCMVWTALHGVDSTALCISSSEFPLPGMTMTRRPMVPHSLISADSFLALFVCRFISAWF